MAASYPASVRTYLARTDFTDTVLAADVNSLQEEVTAIQSILGVTPSLSTTGSGGAFSTSAITYSTVSARLANLEKGLVAISTRALDNAVLHLAGTETVTGAKTFTGAVTFGDSAVAGQSVALVGQGMSLTIGAPTVANSPQILFKSSGVGSGQDVLVQATGGTGSGYGGTLTVSAGLLKLPALTSVLGDATTLAGAPSLLLQDTKSGQTTPNKYLISRAGSLQVLDSGRTNVLLTLTDVGNLTLAGPNLTVQAAQPRLALLDTTAAQATPNKYLVSHSGMLRIFNSAFSASILDLADDGTLAVNDVKIGGDSIGRGRHDGIVPIETNQTGITGTVDVTNSSFSTTLVAGRFYRFVASGVGAYSSVVNDLYQIGVVVGGTQRALARGISNSTTQANSSFMIDFMVECVASGASGAGQINAGTYTCKLIVSRGGTGTLILSASAGAPITFYVEDMGNPTTLYRL